MYAVIDDKATKSGYMPSSDVIDLTKNVKEEFFAGWSILNDSREEFNYYSVIDRMNKDQRTFNSLVDDEVDDPREAWKWKGTRSLARNKAMVMHAHMTAQYVIANVSAQNQQQEEDVAMGNIMKDITEWMTVNSHYREAILLTTMGILVNPVTYMGAEYTNVFQKVKERQDNGEIITKEIVDEVLSGFQVPVYSANQILITNAYEQNIQKQRSLIKQRWVEKSELWARWHEHENWEYVKVGQKAIFDSDDSLFYNIIDEEHPHLVAEETYYCRRTDSEIVFLGGIYMGEENVEMGNLMNHRDNRDAPKYNVIPFGYERINEHFTFYKSLMFRVGWDDKLLDSLYEIGMNKAILDTLMPVAISGVDGFDSQVIFPSSVVSFQSPDARVQPLLPTSGQNVIFNAMSKVEESMEQASVSKTFSGDLPEASQKAFTVGKAEQHAKTILKGAMQNFALSITQYWPLMVDVALQHLTVPEVDEITNGLTYRKFVLEDQMVNGKHVSKKLLFDESLMGKKMDKEEIRQESLKLLQEAGFPETKEHIYRVNPHLFSKMKYLVRYDPDLMNEKNEDFERALAQNLYTLLRVDPLIEPEALVRKLLNSFYRGESEDLMAKRAPMEIGQVLGGNMKQTSMGAQMGQKQLAGAIAGA